MAMESNDRRAFLQMAAGAVGAAALPPGVARALALPANRATGTIRDVEHVVILMQENRSFDHYLGTLRGVRGFGDPRPIELPSGRPVWAQPAKDGVGTVGPFRLDSGATRAETIFSLDHSWKASHARWKHHDAWIAAKGALSMGYFTRADLPFYYALADAFTVCDAFYCSIFAATCANRSFLFSGTSGLSAGYDGPTAVTNPPDEPNETADPANDGPKFKPLTWTTYAERLQAAGVSWRVYQEFDNFGDNGLAYFANFRGIGPESELYRRGRAWVPGSTPANAKTSNGEHLVREFAADVAADRLPQVSWIVPSFKLCEHPSATPSDGAWLTARLIAALTANPKVWAKTALILNYDENDGFFDHVPPPVPAAGPALGKMSGGAEGEVYHGEPVGLGPRVPAIVVSPWTKGGFVNSEVFDHTSIIRFLEARFGVHEPNISPWRRAICGDLTSVFDFKTPNRAIPPLPDVSAMPARAEKAKALPFPLPPKTPEPHPRQEPGQRPARALPYEFQVNTHYDDGGFRLTMASIGEAGLALNLYRARGGEPRFYAMGKEGYLTDLMPVDAGPYSFAIHGPNGYLRTFGGEFGAPVRPEANGWFDRADNVLRIALHNEGTRPIALEVASAAYIDAAPRIHRLAPGAVASDTWDLRPSHNWYDFVVTCVEAPSFRRRLAGHGEDGRPSVSDPLLGRQA
ncbi:MAG: phosphocholine-specific phospholipase C [Phenylobacterium sp.]